jgi:hypothetical protein
VKGNTAITVNRQGGLFDTSSKDDGAYATQGPGLKAVSLSVHDSAEPARRQWLYPPRDDRFDLAGTADELPGQEGRLGGRRPDDTCSRRRCTSRNLNTSYPMNGVLEASFELGLAGAPTIDALA